MLHQIRRVVVSGRHVPTVTFKNEPDVFYVIGPMFVHGPFPLNDDRFELVQTIRFKKRVTHHELRTCAKIADMNAQM